MATTSDLINSSGSPDLTSNSDLNTLGASAVTSSAPPFQNLINSGKYAATGTVNTDTLVSQLGTESQNPTLLPGESFSSTPIVSSASDTLGNNVKLAPLTPVNTSTATASYAALPQVTKASGYVAQQGTAVTGKVDPASLTQNQLTNVLNSNTNANGIPDWSQVPATASNQRMNALGLGASTMAANAETGAILTAALPLAEQNAHTYQLMNTQNVTNEQYTMLSNTSMTNAALNFNAKNEQQNNQFFGSLTNATQLANAASATAVSKYNAGQKNSVNEFNTKTQDARDQFNSANQLVIDQSNVKWSRAVNTANTASTNADNNANVKNTFNIQQSGLNDLWQQARDEASWSLTSSENSQNRALSLTNSSLNRKTSYGLLTSTLNANKYAQLGSFGVGLLGGTSGISSGIKSLVNGTSSSSYGSSSGSSYAVSSVSPASSSTTYKEGGFITNTNSIGNDPTMANGVDLTVR